MPSNDPKYDELHKQLFEEGLKMRRSVVGDKYVDGALANGSTEFSREGQELTRGDNRAEQQRRQHTQARGAHHLHIPLPPPPLAMLMAMSMPRLRLQPHCAPSTLCSRQELPERRILQIRMIQRAHRPRIEQRRLLLILLLVHRQGRARIHRRPVVALSIIPERILNIILILGLLNDLIRLSRAARRLLLR